MHHLKFFSALFLGAALLLMVGTATVPAADSSSGVAVTIQSFAFSPDTVTVPVGTTVVWTNNDSVGHTVTSDSGAFDSGTLGQGQSFQFTFKTAGTFAYHCSIHPSMTAEVVATQATEEVQEFALIHSLKDMAIYPSTITVKKGIKVRLFNTATDGSHPTVAISSDVDGKNPVFGVQPFDVEVGKLTPVEFIPDQTGTFFITHHLHGHDIVGKLIVQDGQ